MEREPGETRKDLDGGWIQRIERDLRKVGQVQASSQCSSKESSAGGAHESVSLPRGVLCLSGKGLSIPAVLSHWLGAAHGKQGLSQGAEMDCRVQKLEAISK